MNSRHNTNKNLTLTNERKFNGKDINFNNGPLSVNYLDRIESVMGNALGEHARTLIIRVDLHLPSTSNCPDNPFIYDTTMISRFIDSFKSKIKWDLEGKRRRNARVHPCTVRYIWIKERHLAEHDHYHLAILLNRDAYFALGDYNRLGNNLVNKVIDSWASALGLDALQVRNLVSFPNDPTHHLNSKGAQFNNAYNAAFKRLSYFAKIVTKNYGNSSNNFGCSRK